MFRVRRRGATRTALLVLLTVAMTSGLATPLASGTSISGTEGQIATLSKELTKEEQNSEITSNRYDAEEAALSSINANIVGLKSKEAAKRVVIQSTQKKLVAAVVNAYVYGASQAQIISVFNQNVNRASARKVFESQVIGDLNKLEVQFKHEKTRLQGTIAKVATQRAKAEHASYELSVLLAANVRLENKTQALLATIKGRLKIEIINYAINQGIAAARAGNVAGEEQAIATATQVGGQSAANQVIDAEQQAVKTPTIAEVAGSAQGLRAVAAAKSQIGVPYVWGGETPHKGFDCSGLVQWAWAQAGITIPRTTETQWPAMLHVSPLNLQPGDLLFYYNLDGDHEVDHVVMYVGSGPWGVDTTIAAPYTGTDVELAPFFSAGFIGAARP